MYICLRGALNCLYQLSSSYAVINSAAAGQLCGLALSLRAFATQVKPQHSCRRDAFAPLRVPEPIAELLAGKQVHYPTPVQEVAIPLILDGHSCAIQSFTGSGKTLAYLLPILTMLSPPTEGRVAEQPKHAIIVAPSHELCMQIVRQAQELLPERQQDVQQAICGANITRQIKALAKHTPALVVGTPARVAMLLQRGHLMAYRRQLLVLDEADQLLHPRYQQHVALISASVGKSLPQPRQTVLVSATLSAKVLQRASSWCRADQICYITTGEQMQVSRLQVQELRTQHAAAVDAVAPAAGADVGNAAAGAASALATSTWNSTMAPERSVVDGSSCSQASSSAIGSTSSAMGYQQKQQQQTQQQGQEQSQGTETAAAALALAPQLRHFYLTTHHNRRVEVVLKCIRALQLRQVLVFVNTPQRLDFAQSRLERTDVPVGVLHGELKGAEAAAMLARFRNGKLRALVVSDLAARGLDFPDCDGVIHLELSWRPAQYSHRAGRTGRMGRPGVVLSIVTEPQEQEVVQLGKRLGVIMHKAKVVDGNFMVKPIEAL